MDEEREQDITAEEKLRQLDASRKSLRAQIKDERTIRLEEAAKMREIRDIGLDVINKGLNEVLEMIYVYKKFGKVEKYKRNIFQEIIKLLNREDVQRYSNRLGSAIPTQNKPGGENGKHSENSE